MDNYTVKVKKQKFVFHVCKICYVLFSKMFRKILACITFNYIDVQYN